MKAKGQRWFELLNAACCDAGAVSGPVSASCLTDDQTSQFPAVQYSRLPWDLLLLEASSRTEPGIKAYRRCVGYDPPASVLSSSVPTPFFLFLPLIHSPAAAPLAQLHQCYQLGSNQDNSLLRPHLLFFLGVIDVLHVRATFSSEATGCHHAALYLNRKRRWRAPSHKSWQVSSFMQVMICR